MWTLKVQLLVIVGILLDIFCAMGLMLTGHTGLGVLSSGFALIAAVLGYRLSGRDIDPSWYSFFKNMEK